MRALPAEGQSPPVPGAPPAVGLAVRPAPPRPTWSQTTCSPTRGPGTAIASRSGPRLLQNSEAAGRMPRPPAAAEPSLIRPTACPSPSSGARPPSGLAPLKAEAPARTGAELGCYSGPGVEGNSGPAVVARTRRGLAAGRNSRLDNF
jgi:hypothetical protein